MQVLHGASCTPVAWLFRQAVGGLWFDGRSLVASPGFDGADCLCRIDIVARRASRVNCRNEEAHQTLAETVSIAIYGCISDGMGHFLPIRIGTACQGD